MTDRERLEQNLARQENLMAGGTSGPSKSERQRLEQNMAGQEYIITGPKPPSSTSSEQQRLARNIESQEGYANATGSAPSSASISASTAASTQPPKKTSIITNPTFPDSIVNKDSAYVPIEDSEVIGEITSDILGSTNDGNISIQKQPVGNGMVENWKKFDSSVTDFVDSLQKAREEFVNNLAESKERLKAAQEDFDKRYQDTVAAAQEKIANVKLGQIPGNGVLANALNNSLIKDVNKMFVLAGESFAFLANAAMTFAKGILDKALGVLMSNIFVPENVYLEGLKVVTRLLSSPKELRNNNDYLRKQCITHDYAKALKWIDNKVGIRYTSDNDIAMQEGKLAASSGAIRVVDYIMGHIYRESEEYTYYIESTKFIVDIPEEEEKELPKEKQEELKEIRKELKKIEDKEKKCKINLHILLKEMIIGSYSHLEGVRNAGPNALGNTFAQITTQATGMDFTTVSSVVDKYKLKPSALGTTDKEFNKAATITTSDLNKFIPFWNKPKPTTQSLSVSKDEDVNKALKATKQIKTSGSFIADTHGSGASLMRPFQQNIPDEYIVARNSNIKQIYVYLTSEVIHGKENVMVNVPFHDRLIYPFYDTFVEQGDQAMAGFFQTGLGTMISKEVSLDGPYLYGLKMEPLIYSPKKTVFMQVQDMTPLPNPIGHPEELNKSSNSNPPVVDPIAGEGKKILEQKIFNGNLTNPDGTVSEEYISWVDSIIKSFYKDQVLDRDSVLAWPFVGVKFENGNITNEYLAWINANIEESNTILGIEFELSQLSITYFKPIEKLIIEEFSGTVIKPGGESSTNIGDKCTPDYIKWLEDLFYKETEPNNVYNKQRYNSDGTMTTGYSNWLIAKLLQKNLTIGETQIPIYVDLRTIDDKLANGRYRGIPFVDWSKMNIDDYEAYKQIAKEYFKLTHGYNSRWIYTPGQ